MMYGRRSSHGDELQARTDVCNHSNRPPAVSSTGMAVASAVLDVSASASINGAGIATELDSEAESR